MLGNMTEWKTYLGRVVALIELQHCLPRVIGAEGSLDVEVITNHGPKGGAEVLPCFTLEGLRGKNFSVQNRLDSEDGQ